MFVIFGAKIQIFNKNIKNKNNILGAKIQIFDKRGKTDFWRENSRLQKEFFFSEYNFEFIF